MLCDIHRFNIVMFQPYYSCSWFIWIYQVSTENHLLSLWIYGPRQAKKRLRTCAKCTDSDHPAHAQNAIRAFSLHTCILLHPMNLLADSEGLDQLARMRRLIWALAVCICPHGADHINVFNDTKCKRCLGSGTITVYSLPRHYEEEKTNRNR